MSIEPSEKSKRPRRGRGEGNVEELPSGKFRAVLSCGIDPTTRKRCKQTFTADTKKEALVWMRERQAEQSKGQLATPGKMLVKEWLDTWLASKKASLAPRSYEQYEEHVRLHLTPHVGGVQLCKLTSDVISRFYADVKLSAPMLVKVAKTLRMALKAAVPRYLASNPSSPVPTPRAEAPEFNVWDADQARDFLGSVRGNRLEALYMLALDSGMRQGELFGLEWSDLKGNVVSVARSLEEDKQGNLRTKPPKTKAGRRRLPLCTTTMAALTAHRERMRAEGRDVETGSIFVDTTGGWLRKTNLPFAKLVKKSGVPLIRFHDLRHTSATQLLLRGINIKAVSVRLGHQSIKVTLDTYSHFLPEMDAQIVAVVEEFLAIVPPVSHGEPENVPV